MELNSSGKKSAIGKIQIQKLRKVLLKLYEFISRSGIEAIFSVDFG